ncbi:MAG: hypothetical protein Q9174_006435 [Haloplaca sp. 1 TL-2023]
MEPDVERSVVAHPPPEDRVQKVRRSSTSSQPVGKGDSDAQFSPSGTPPDIGQGENEEKDERDAELAHTTSAADSAHSLPVKVPKARRRGLFARFVVLAEVENPKSYARRTKWFITLIIALAAVAAPLGSAIILPTLLDIAVDLDTTPTVANLSVAFYMLAMAIFPLWWSSFSETLGRRTIYIVSFTFFVLWTILAAVSANVAMLIVMRLLSGGASASVQAVGAGTIADIWEVHERGHAMSIFYLGPLMGPFLAPIIGGVLAEKLGWRSTQWALAVYGGLVLLFVFFALPETLKNPKPPIEDPPGKAAAVRPKLERTVSAKVLHQRTKTLVKWFKRGFLDPLKILLYLRFPAVAISVYYAAITFGALYLLNISLETTFSQSPYNFGIIEVGLTYIPNSLGYISASLFGGKWTDKIMAREAKRAKRYDEKGKLIYRPEDRMRENAWIAAFLYPCALIWYGWTAEKGIIWIVPVRSLLLSQWMNQANLISQLIANFFFGVGTMLIFAMVTTMLTEFMPRKASSGVACNNFVRCSFSCIGALTAQPLISAIGDGWLFTGVGIITLASGNVIWAMRRFGPRWRETMDAHME